MNETLLHFNGIDGDTGSYDLPPMTAEDLVKFVRGEATPENLNELRFRHQRGTAKHLGVKEGVDATKLDEAGWGVIFPQYPVAEAGRQKEVQELVIVTRFHLQKKRRTLDRVLRYVYSLNRLDCGCL